MISHDDFPSIRRSRSTLIKSKNRACADSVDGPGRPFDIDCIMFPALRRVLELVKDLTGGVWGMQQVLNGSPLLQKDGEGPAEAKLDLRRQRGNMR